jgi:phosphoribosyl-ATP pyrophosphohydrolase/phosphoribosyl-AMP cyclohydrolase
MSVDKRVARETTSLDALRFTADGLVPVVIVDARTNELLTLAYANREALERTISERSTWLYSRSRGALWNKGETSGNTQRVLAVDVDCDADAVRYRVLPNGPACHTGARSCFDGASLFDDDAAVEKSSSAVSESGAFARAIEHLRSTIASRRGAPPESSYTARLLAAGVDKIGKKIGEEATEVVIAAKNNDPREIAWEVADLVYHTLVLLEERGVSLDEIGDELLRRAK